MTRYFERSLTAASLNRRLSPKCRSPPLPSGASARKTEILKLRMDGLTEQEIADKVGYKTASAVHKRIAKIVGAYEGLRTAE